MEDEAAEKFISVLGEITHILQASRGSIYTYNKKLDVIFVLP